MKYMDQFNWNNYSNYLKMADDFFSMVPYNENNHLRCPVSKFAPFVYPRYNLEVTPTSYVYTVDVPGGKKDDLVVKEENGVMTIEGKREKNVSEEGTDYKYSESHYGKFSRSFKLEDDSVYEDMTAKLDEGLLYVTVPRKELTTESGRTVDIE
jgi:HSP20 family protein